GTGYCLRAGGRTMGSRVVLYAALFRSGQKCRVVGTGNVDRHAGRGAVGGDDAEAVGIGRTGGKLVMRVARRVGPRTAAIDGEGEVATAHAGIGVEAKRPIHIADRQKAG